MSKLHVSYHFIAAQVSHSVVILALLFVSRLKSKNPINGLPGSEFRASITALALGNKVLDDNTYTAKTWAEVSGLDLVRSPSPFLLSYFPPDPTLTEDIPSRMTVTPGCRRTRVLTWT